MENNSSFEDFLKIFGEKVLEEKSKLNIELYNQINTSVEKISTNINTLDIGYFEAFEDIEKISSSCNLNDVTEIYLYETCYSNSSELFCNMFSTLILREFCKKYKNNNFAFIENIILNEKENRGETALNFYIRISKFHAEHQLRVLNFIEKNYKNFSNNQKVICNLLFDQLLSHSPQAMRIKKLLNVKELVIRYGGEVNDDIISNRNKKKWWKFW